MFVFPNHHQQTMFYICGSGMTKVPLYLKALFTYFFQLHHANTLHTLSNFNAWDKEKKSENMGVFSLYYLQAMKVTMCV